MKNKIDEAIELLKKAKEEDGDESLESLREAQASITVAKSEARVEKYNGN